MVPYTMQDAKLQTTFYRDHYVYLNARDETALLLEFLEISETIHT
jgi:hypothetical protein